MHLYNTQQQSQAWWFKKQSQTVTTAASSVHNAASLLFMHAFKKMKCDWQGVSPALSQEICALAAIFSQDPVDTPPHEWQELFKQWQNWLTRLQDGIPANTLVIAQHTCILHLLLLVFGACALLQLCCC